MCDHTCMQNNPTILTNFEDVEEGIKSWVLAGHVYDVLYCILRQLAVLGLHIRIQDWVRL